MVKSVKMGKVAKALGFLVAKTGRVSNGQKCSPWLASRKVMKMPMRQMRQMPQADSETSGSFTTATMGSPGHGNRGNRGNRGNHFGQGIQGMVRGNTDMLESYDKRIMESMVVEKESRFPNGLLNPRWIGKLGWDFGVMFFVLMDAIVLPFQLTFKSNANDQMDAFDLVWLWITTVVFATDILLSFNTAVERGERDRHSGKLALILDRCQIAKLYLRGWFIIDFGSAVPWAQIF